MHKSYLLFILLLAACTSKTMSDDYIENLILTHPKDFPEVSKDIKKYEIQVLYTQIDRDAQNNPSFKTISFNANKDAYFYPASTVKFPAAVLALEKLNQLSKEGLDKYSTMITDSARAPQFKTEKDSTSVSGLPSLAHYIKKIFLISDNEAFNRVFEFLGADYLNNSLHQKGYTDARIIRRLASSKFQFADNKYTNPIQFYKDSTLVYRQAEQTAQKVFPFPNTNPLKGRAYYDSTEDKIIDEPFDFSEHNYLSLETMHNVLKAVIFPTSVEPKQRFDLKEDDYNYLYRCMAQLPRESKYPDYDDKEYYDGYAKYWIFGSDKNKIPSNIRVFNKVGLAYGYLIETAYIVDFDAKVEFMLSAVIYVNENETLNDNKYEYDKIGFPFFTKLGKLIMDEEKKRSRPFPPDLSRFKLDFED